ncbi:MAG: hypothetical protein AW08_00890 [Candidatus Accumulibacter adjunctus]|uniref:Uncharacterized protein n=1 Tax=Candidatus Accumulibacter adjunctus TaxID=1454001 RepID=A0A011MFJ4_9PROT|nr:MAG: hypothetical protein AW08_00890 [Candidatus Accumulibacter adjunctus]
MPFFSTKNLRNQGSFVRPQSATYSMVSQSDSAAAIAITSVSTKSCSVPLLDLRGSSTSLKPHIRLAPFVTIISVAQETRVDLILEGFTSHFHKFTNVDDSAPPSMTIANIPFECGRPPLCERLRKQETQTFPPPSTTPKISNLNVLNSTCIDTLHRINTSPNIINRQLLQFFQRSKPPFTEQEITPCVLIKPIPDNLTGNPGDNCIWWYIPCNDSARRKNRTSTDLNTEKYCDSMPNPTIVANDRPLHPIIALGQKRRAKKLILTSFGCKWMRR